MEENNNQVKVKLTTIIVLQLLVVIIIVGIVFVIFNKNNDSKSSNIKENNSVYNIKLPTGFVPHKIEQCTNYQLLGGIKYSVESAEEAVNYIRTFYDENDAKNSELLKLELIDEEDFYYSVFMSYKSNYNGITYDSTYIFFKREIIDVDNKQINLNNISDKDKIKTIFNTYNYVYHYQNSSYKIENSNIIENDDKYIYTIYFYEIIYGDWGLNDRITHFKQNIIINKKDGTYIFEDKEILDAFDGNYNPNPLIY